MQIVRNLSPASVTAVQSSAKVACASFSSKPSFMLNTSAPGYPRTLLGLGSSFSGARSVTASSYQYQTDEASIEEVDFDPKLTNSITLMGNVGRKPELKFLESGNKVANWSLAVTEKKGAETTWYDVEAWGALAECAANEVEKGQKVTVQGALRVRDYTDAQGVPRKAIKIVANSVKRIRYMPRGEGGFQTDNWQQQQQQTPSSQQSYNNNINAERYPASSQASSQGGGGGGAAGQQTNEELWMSFFEDAAGWYDNRPRKVAGEMNPKSPDFKRKEGGRDAPALWIDSRGTPAWVKTELQKLDSMGSDVPPF